MDSDNNYEVKQNYMVIDCNNDYWLTEFDNYEEAINYFNELKQHKSYDQKIRLIQFYNLEEANYG